MSTNTGGQAFPGPHWSEGETGMTLLDWMAGQALAGMLACPLGSGCAEVNAIEAYKYAAAMLAEKARREADHSDGVNKMVPDHSPDACALLRKFIDAVPEGFETSILWDLRTEAIHLLDVVPDHIPDAGKMVLEAANKELVEALDAMLKWCGSDDSIAGPEIAAREAARAVLAKNKGEA